MPNKTRWWLIGLAALTVIRLAVAARMALSPDEAYYWTWSHALAPGYLDHPPMVALWIRAGTWIAGENTLGVRLFAPLSAALGSVLLARAGEDCYRGSGVPAAVLLNATLVMAAGAVTMTPDTPLLFFWVAAMWGVARLVRTGRAEWWLVVGVSAGLALDSKYTALLFGLGIVVWLLGVPAARRWLRHWQLWAGGALAAGLFAPVLVWNAAHGWESFARQGGRAGDFAPSLRYVGELVAGQLALGTPFVFGLCAWGVGRAVRRWREDPAWPLLAALTLAPAAIFVQHALGDRVQANWPAVLYPSAAIAAGAIGRFWRPAALFGFVIAGAVYLQATIAPLGLARRFDPTLVRLGGWTEFARDADQAREAAGASFLVAEPYGVAAELAWHVPAGTVVLATEPRWHDFDFPGLAATGPGLLIQTERRATPPDPAPWTSIAPAGRLVRGRAGVEAEAFRLYRVVPRPGLQAPRLPNPQELP